MGACTFALDGDGHGVEDQYRYVEGVLTLSASYATGGDTIPMASMPFKQVFKVHQICTSGNNDGSSLVLGGTSTAPKVVLYTGDGTEASNASNNSGLEFPARIYGR